MLLATGEVPDLLDEEEGGSLEVMAPLAILPLLCIK